MPIKGMKLCGARCRTKAGAPCTQIAMKNGRCKMHGGCFYKKEIHGRYTLMAKAERKKENALLRELMALSQAIKEI